MPEERIYQLIDLFFKGEITEEENAELAHLVGGHAKDDNVLAELLSHAWQHYEPAEDIRDLAGKRLQGVPEKILAAAKPAEAARVITFRKTWVRIAAIFLLVIAGAITWYSIRQSARNTTPQLAVKPADLPPGGKKATLTLANGSVIELDSSANGNLASQGDVNITKQDGILTYPFSKSHAATIQYNTVATPRGGEYSVVLPDGSKVWLNAASSSPFPHFLHGKRKEGGNNRRSVPGSKVDTRKDNTIHSGDRTGR